MQNKPYILRSAEAHLHNYQSKHFEKTQYGKRLAKLQDCHKGEKCIIVGNGPSLRVEDLQRIYELKIPSFGTNRIFKVFNQTDWRPTYYVTEDILLMRDAQKEIEAMPAEKRFIPIHLHWDENINIQNADYFFMHYKAQLPDTFDLSTDIPHHVCCGATVTVTCIELAAYMGFSEIYLIGVDHNFAKMVDKNGNVIEDTTVQNHFLKDYTSGIASKDQKIIDEGFHVDDATDGYIRAEKLSRKLGTFRIFNATRGGKLEVFERMSLDDLLKNN